MDRNNPNAANNEKPNDQPVNALDIAARQHQNATATRRVHRPPNNPAPRNLGNIKPGAPALLEPSAAYSLHTDQRRSPNAFVPDSQTLFHILGHCDHLMGTTHRFTSATPSWIPIVSQLYVSFLWITMLIQVYVRSGYGISLETVLHQLMTVLQIGECMIPGPLVPFFQSLAAVAGPSEWIGDIFPALPDFGLLWNNEDFHPHASYARILPIPAIMLDQLYYFATWAVPANQSIYYHFEWYRNVFSAGQGTYSPLNRMGPQLCGSLSATETQVVAARDYWNPIFANRFTRITTTGNPLTLITQLLGLVSQTGSLQYNWFPTVAATMQRYSEYFNGSVPLKAINPLGLGAVAVLGRPHVSPSLRTWLYPTLTNLAPFRSTRYTPLREIPPSLAVTFSHSDQTLEEQAEQFAITVHTNMVWSGEIQTVNNWTPIDESLIHVGDYWTEEPIRQVTGVSLSTQFLQVITSRYHRFIPNRAD